MDHSYMIHTYIHMMHTYMHDTYVYTHTLHAQGSENVWIIPQATTATERGEILILSQRMYLSLLAGKPRIDRGSAHAGR